MTIAAKLLAHYDRHARKLPWRSPPGSNAPDPYRVWLSEIMLQQTTVAAVKPYFEEFAARWPDVTALANADEAELMAAWAGLGYYARARNLLACARTIAEEHGGRFPASEAALLQQAGAARAQADIRAVVNQESNQLAEADKTFIDRLIFWRKPEEPGTVVDPQREAQRIRENEALGRTVSEGETPSIKRRRRAPLEGIF